MIINIRLITEARTRFLAIHNINNNNSDNDVWYECDKTIWRTRSHGQRTKWCCHWITDVHHIHKARILIFQSIDHMIMLTVFQHDDNDDDNDPFIGLIHKIMWFIPFFLVRWVFFSISFEKSTQYNMIVDVASWCCVLWSHNEYIIEYYENIL